MELHHCGTQVLETERLILRPFVMEDAEAMYRNWASSETVTRYLTWPAHTDTEVTRSIIAMWLEGYRDPTVYQWGITLRGTDEVIGGISVVSISAETASAELGWCLGEAWWGRGIMPEAAKAVCDFLFDEVGCNRVEARHDRNNPKSGRVMQKIGMRYEGTMRAAGLNNQGLCDTVLYAILRDDREKGMELRKAAAGELDSVRDFYWELIDRMAERKTNGAGWKKGIYPTEEFMRESIENGTLYVMEDERGLAACTVLNSEWNEGYEGLPWRTDCAREEVLVPHILAVRADIQGKGVGQLVVREIISLARASGKRTVRLDVLSGNTAAERLYTKMGFQYVQAKNMYYEDTGWTEFIMYELVL